MGAVGGDGMILEEALLMSFYAYAPEFTGGARVGAVDRDGDGRAEVLSGIGPGGGPHMRVWGPGAAELDGFFAFDPAFTGGIFVAGR